ncbi:cupin-like domain-containing protein [Sparassis latifolia]
MHPATRQFGTDVQRVSMPFREFLASLSEDSEKPHHYLTTQYADDDEDLETLFSPPTDALMNDFPRVPRLMGNLCLQQVNLWLGKSADGSSSGLHHDFHDNLYCLLQGRKRFVLLQPAEVEHLYPHGQLDTLHANGLISYADAPVRADGLSARAACKARVQALERKINVLPRKDNGHANTRERQALLDALDDARDELAQLALDSGELEGEIDDFDALVGGLQDECDESASGASTDHDEDEVEQEEALGGPLAEGDSEPASFSRIPTAYLHKHLGLPTTAMFPTSASLDFSDLAKTNSPYIVELSAGEMLYLPASWWHEVTSSSVLTRSDGSAVHMAFNYWFYPPDALESFEQPYADALVWDYLREKASRDETGLAWRARKGKRKQEVVEDKALKKLRW